MTIMLLINSMSRRLIFYATILLLFGSALGQEQSDGKVVFVWGDLGIHIMEFEGNDQPQFVVNQGIHPVWSPDGTQIVFVNSQNGSLDIYTVNTDGSELTQLTVNSANNFAPEWSPDGSQIAFFSDRDGNAEIYLMNTDGTGQINITNHSAHDMYPTWSPDGTQIAFMSNRDGDFEIFTVNLDGTNLSQITSNTNFDRYPEWSPDGSQIAFASIVGDEYAQIYIIPVSGGIPTQITESLVDFGDFQWNSNSTSIIYLYQNRLVSQPIDGSPSQILFQLPASDFIGIANFDLFQPAACPPGSVDISASDTTALITAITDANGTPEADTICLTNSAYTFTTHHNTSNGPNALPAITSDITIIGNGATLARSGSNNFRFFMVESTGTLTLEDVTLTNGNPGSGYRGGNIRTHGTLTLNGVVLSYGNSAYGGGLYATSGGSVTVEDSTITANTGTNGGGAYIDSGTADFTDTAITYNTGSSGAGIFTNTGTTVTLHNITIAYNTASGWGGGIHNRGVLMVSAAEGETNSSISNNTGSNGAGISNNGGSATFIYTNIDGNTSTGSLGGGLHIPSGTVTIGVLTNVRFNSSVTSGGGIWNAGNLTITNSTVSNNSSSHAAGLDNEGTLAIDFSVFDSNTLTSSGFGGAMELNSSQSMSIFVTTISNNEGRNGAGIYLLNGTVDISSSDFTSNDGVNGVGLFIASGGTATVSNSTFNGNTGDDLGGGILSAGSLTVTNTVFTANSAGIRGGAIYTSAGTASITNSSCIYSNTSPDTTGIYGHAAGVTATGNWWGAANGPGGAGPGSGDEVNGNVNYSSFLTASPGC